MANTATPPHKNAFDYNSIIDAGGRLRVSQINSLLDLKQTNDNQPLFWDRENIGTGAQVYDIADGGTTMSVLVDGDAAISQSKAFAPYFAGKSQLIEITFSGFESEEGVTKRAGYFSTNTTTPFDSDKDGIWFESTEAGYFFVIENLGVEVFRYKLREPTVDFSKFNVFLIDFLYLGGTAVRMGFIGDGGIKWFAQYRHAGFVPDTFIESPNQPIRYEIRSTGGSGSLVQICAQVASEGSISEIGASLAVLSEAFSATSSGQRYAMLGIRLKPEYRNIRIDKEDIALLATTNDNYVWYIAFNPTYASTVTWNDVNNSSIQFAVGTNANTIADDAAFGRLLDTGFGTGNANVSKPFRNSLRLGSNIDGTPDELWLCVKPLSPNLTIYSEITINEFL